MLPIWISVTKNLMQSCDGNTQEQMDSVTVRANLNCFHLLCIERETC